jgi:short-subunit dehydrogenase
VEDLVAAEPSITMLVNNAGVGAVAPLLESNVDAMQAMIDLNVTAVTRLTYAVAPQLVARGGGAIINIASVVAIAPELLNGVYGASKAFVLALSLSLQKELAGRNVRVQAVLPGATATKFWSDAGRPVEELPSAIVMNAEEMVDAALAGFDVGELVTIPALPDEVEWQAYEGLRQKMTPNLSNSRPAMRYQRRKVA